jgi:hypothetical protein
LLLVVAVVVLLVRAMALVEVVLAVYLPLFRA